MASGASPQIDLASRGVAPLTFLILICKLERYVSFHSSVDGHSLSVHVLAVVNNVLL